MFIRYVHIHKATPNQAYDCFQLGLDQQRHLLAICLSSSMFFVDVGMLNLQEPPEVRNLKSNLCVDLNLTRPQT